MFLPGETTLVDNQFCTKLVATVVIISCHSATFSSTETELSLEGEFCTHLLKHHSNCVSNNLGSYCSSRAASLLVCIPTGFYHNFLRSVKVRVGDTDTILSLFPQLVFIILPSNMRENCFSNKVET